MIFLVFYHNNERSQDHAGEIILQHTRKCCPGHLADMWIAINDLAVEGQYRWAITEEHATWTNWNPGMPANTDYEDCGFLRPVTGWWGDRICTEKKYPLCEYP